MTPKSVAGTISGFISKKFSARSEPAAIRQLMGVDRTSGLAYGIQLEKAHPAACN
jgi:hypothetical protein